MNKILIAGAVALIGGGLFYGLSDRQAVAQTTQTILPELSELALVGEENYNGTCAACHGVNLAGTSTGPTFLHQFYVKNHHGDMAFVVAAKQGVRQHHWRFGDMPAQEQVTDEELGSIITYIREIQAANGF